MLLSAGCRSVKAPAPAASDSPLSGSTAEAGPTSFSQVTPGDTAAVIALMRSVMSDIDGALDGFERRDTVLATTPDSEPRQLTVWLERGLPRKLTVSEPREPGHSLAGESDYWLTNNELTVVQSMTDAYALDANRIVLWTDQMLVPVTGFTADQRMAREILLVEQARKYLAAFGMVLP